MLGERSTKMFRFERNIGVGVPYFLRKRAIFLQENMLGEAFLFQKITLTVPPVASVIIGLQVGDFDDDEMFELKEGKKDLEQIKAIFEEHRFHNMKEVGEYVYFVIDRRSLAPSLLLGFSNGPKKKDLVGIWRFDPRADAPVFGERGEFLRFVKKGSTVVDFDY